MNTMHNVGICIIKCGTVWSKIFIDFITLNVSRRIQQKIATNRIKFGTLEPEILPAKGCTTSLRWAYDVTMMAQACQWLQYHVTIFIHVTISFVLAVEVHLYDTQGISGAQLPYRRRERRMFVLYISARQLSYYHL